MSPTVDNKTLGSSETGSEDSEDEDEFEDLLESDAEEEEVANYKNLLTEETLKTDILRKVRQTCPIFNFSLPFISFCLNRSS